MSGDVYIGSETVPSELIVTDGGRVSSTGEMIVGGPSADHDLGRVEVSGSNSFLSANTLRVGVKGHGVLTISGGAQVQSATGGVGNTQLGPAVGSGVASITGTPLSPSEWRMTGNGFVGTDEPGSVLLNGTTIGPFSVGGATLRVDGTLTLGLQGLINGNGTLAAGHRVVNGGLISPGKLDGAVTGSFAQIIFPQLAPGFQFKTEIVNGSFKLTALNNAVLAPTPTPTPTPTPSPTPTPIQSPNVLQFSSSNYGVIEACTTVTITVNRIGDTSGTASVEYFTADVTATERRDYITAIGKLSFATGETSKSFAVLINDDSYVEGSETFSVNLRNPSGASLGAPAIATVQITDNPSEPATNVIDDPQNFVCQHYHDFLNRQADASGLAFWTNEITSCGTNQQCIDAKRINVSAAYFLSLEFQQTGYLVERMYKTAYGDANGSSTFGGTHQLAVPIVRFNEFLTDTQRIGLGVVVGQTGWEQQLENNKQAFASEYVLRSRFITAYPTSMTPTQFVDKLNQNAGNVLSSSDRAAAIGLFGGAVNTNNSTARALALRQVAENQNLSSAEFNRAFVLMQFFGYLRRNPDDLPDSDYTGYDFWLTKLNQFNGNFVNAEMVKAFITSVEYRSRFGP